MSDLDRMKEYKNRLMDMLEEAETESGLLLSAMLCIALEAGVQIHGKQKMKDLTDVAIDMVQT